MFSTLLWQPKVGKKIEIIYNMVTVVQWHFLDLSFLWCNVFKIIQFKLRSDGVRLNSRD